MEKKDAKRALIFCPESGAPKDFWEKYAYFLPSGGFHLISMDFSNPEVDSKANSLAQWPLEDEVQRLLTVIRWAKKALSADLEILLFGVSKGADVALAASFHDVSVKAVVADGLFSMKEIFRDYIRKWAPILVKPNFFGENYPDWVVYLFADLSFWFAQKKAMKKFVDVEKLLKINHVPLLMIHGQMDDYVPQTHQKRLWSIDRKKSSSRHLIIPQARHNEAVVLAKDTYEKTIFEFLENIR